MNKFYQVCYGKPDKTNWSSFNMANDTPEEVVSFFERTANNNTPQNTDPKFIASREDLFEVVSQDGLTEISKIRYGTSDSFGRATMFAHGFVFNTPERILENPAELLSISNDNFKFTVEETSCIPSCLMMDEMIDINSAMNISNIDASKLQAVLAAINISLSSSTNYPVYIIYNGDERCKKALIFLILSLLPYTLRYKLSFSTANSFKNSMNKSVMILSEADKSEHFIDLENGETNFDLQVVIENKSRYPFYQLLEKNSFADYDKYCKSLLAVQEQLGFGYLCEYDDLLIANTLLKYQNCKLAGKKIQYSKKTDDELVKFLFEFLSKAPLSNSLVDDFVAELLNEYADRNLIPNDILMKRIRYRTEKSNCIELNEIYKKLQMAVLVQNGEKETLKFLKEQRSKNNDYFEEWAKLIVKSNGEKYIDNFFEEFIGTSQRYDEIRDLFIECRTINANTKLSNNVKEKLFELTLKKMIRGQNVSNAFDEVIEIYCKTYFEIFGDDRESASLQNNLIREYWRNYNIKDFEFNEAYLNNVNYIKGNDFEPKVIKMFIAVYDLIEKSSEYDDHQTRQELEEFLVAVGREFDLSIDLRNKLSKTIIEKLNYQTRYHLVFWYNIALFNTLDNNESDAIKNIMKWKIKAFISEEKFKECIENSPRIDRVFLRHMLYVLEGSKHEDGYIDSVDYKSDEYYLIKDRISILSKYLKAKEKEEKKKSKSEDVKSEKKKFGSFFKR